MSEQPDDQSDGIAQPPLSEGHPAYPLHRVIEEAQAMLRPIPPDQTPPCMSEAGLTPDLFVPPSVGGEDCPWPRATPVAPLDPDPVWATLGGLKRLLELLPESAAGVSRLDQCLALLRGTAEHDQFPEAAPDAPAGDGVRLIQYPLIELNWLVEATGSAILSLLDSVDFERTTRQRLRRELEKGVAFLEPDDRGTVTGAVLPTGMTKEKERNNARLDALAAFLHALRRQPYAAIRYAAGELGKVAVPPDLLSTDLKGCTITFRSSVYKVSEPACHLVHLLLVARGRFVSGGDLKKHLQDKGLWEHGQLRMERFLGHLPDDLRAAIVSSRRGRSLNVDQLMSYA